jgi:large subunit ribosomal protein L18
MISNLKRKRDKRANRKRRVRVRIVGTPERPRLTVYRSARHIYVQVIDDSAGKTLVAVSTMDKSVRDSVKGLKKLQAAEKIGEALAERCLGNKIDKVVFDRNGYTYHGRIAMVASAARNKGLVF